MKRIISLVLVLTVLCAATVHAETYTFPNTLNTSTSKTAGLHSYTKPSIKMLNYPQNAAMLTAGSTSIGVMEYKYGTDPNTEWSTSVPNWGGGPPPNCGDDLYCQWRIRNGSRVLLLDNFLWTYGHGSTEYAKTCRVSPWFECPNDSCGNSFGGTGQQVNYSYKKCDNCGTIESYDVNNLWYTIGSTMQNSATCPDCGTYINSAQPEVHGIDSDLRDLLITQDEWKPYF